MTLRSAVGRSVPQSVQQLVMRDYCAARGLSYLLAATEYCMPGSTMMLDAVLHDLDRLEGIVVFSLASLPEDRTARQRLYSAALSKERSIHLAVERPVIRCQADVDRIEEIWLVRDIAAAVGPEDLQRLAAWDAARP